MPLIATESGKKIFLTEDGRKLVTVLPGDGIGPECVESTLRIL
ncbi:Isocitrate dehydrogenase [NADP] [bacterium HR32]|nr:Isocitrate dehydrogenase [NADP] [bacterium HR32]